MVSVQNEYYLILLLSHNKIRRKLLTVHIITIVLLNIALYYQIKTLIGFWCKHELNYQISYVSCKFIYGFIFSCSDGHLIMALLECF